MMPLTLTWRTITDEVFTKSQPHAHTPWRTSTDENPLCDDDQGASHIPLNNIKLGKLDEI